MITGRIGREPVGLTCTGTADGTRKNGDRPPGVSIDRPAEATPRKAAQLAPERRRAPALACIRRDLHGADAGPAVPRPAAELSGPIERQMRALFVARDERVHLDFGHRRRLAGFL